MIIDIGDGKIVIDLITLETMMKECVSRGIMEGARGELTYVAYTAQGIAFEVYDIHRREDKMRKES